MTQTLFGLNVAKLVSDSIASAGGIRDCTLTKYTAGTRTGGSLTAGTNPTTATYECKGFVETRAIRQTGTVVRQGISVVTILGATVDSGTVTPTIDDEALIDGTTWVLEELLSADPAGAVYEFRASTS